MKQTDVKVSFYLKKSEADSGGYCPVMAKLNIGRYSEAAFSVKMRVPKSLWSAGRATGKSVAAREINGRLDEIRAAALNIYTELSAVHEAVTAKASPYILRQKRMESSPWKIYSITLREKKQTKKPIIVNSICPVLRGYIGSDIMLNNRKRTGCYIFLSMSQEENGLTSMILMSFMSLF